MFLAFLKWWYGLGWLEVWRSIPRSINKVSLEFSLNVLMRNLFAPWKRIVTIPGKPIDEKFRAAIDNLVSRTIGFFVRLLTLLAAFIAIGLTTIFSFFLAISWPIFPIISIYFLIRAFTG